MRTLYRITETTGNGRPHVASRPVSPDTARGMVVDRAIADGHSPFDAERLGDTFRNRMAWDSTGSLATGRSEFRFRVVRERELILNHLRGELSMVYSDQIRHTVSEWIHALTTYVNAGQDDGSYALAYLCRVDVSRDEATAVHSILTRWLVSESFGCVGCDFCRAQVGEL